MKVTITWTIKDIKERCPAWTDLQCVEFLERIEDTLTERSIELGWFIIEQELN